MAFFIYEDFEHNERLKQLAKLCAGRETMTFKRTLLPSEVAERKDLYTREQMRLATIEHEFKEYKARKAADIKTIKGNQVEALQIIANESIEVFDEVFLIPDHAKQIMLFVDKMGEVVHSRELKPQERQGRLLLDDQPEGEIIEFENIVGDEINTDPGDQIPVNE